jgi:hypothetical protein
MLSSLLSQMLTMSSPPCLSRSSICTLVQGVYEGQEYQILDASGSDYQHSSDDYEYDQDSTDDAPLHDDDPAEPWGNFMHLEDYN